MEKQVSGIEPMTLEDICYYTEKAKSRGGFKRDIRRHKFAIFMIIVFGKYDHMDESDLPMLSSYLTNIVSIYKETRK